MDVCGPHYCIWRATCGPQALYWRPLSYLKVILIFHSFAELDDDDMRKYFLKLFANCKFFNFKLRINTTITMTITITTWLMLSAHKHDLGFVVFNVNGIIKEWNYRWPSYVTTWDLKIKLPINKFAKEKTNNMINKTRLACNKNNNLFEFM